MNRYSDTSYQSIKDNGKSQVFYYGYVFIMNEATLVWKSSKYSRSFGYYKRNSLDSQFICELVVIISSAVSIILYGLMTGICIPVHLVNHFLHIPKIDP